jgi:ABC-2 type transport system permease protein
MSRVQIDNVRQPAMSTQRLINVYIAEAKYAFLRFIRTPAFVYPTLLFPVCLYFLVGFLFGAFRAKSGEIDIPTYLYCGFATMAAMTPGMFGFGIGLATEREQGLFTLKRAQPMPPMASLLGNVAMSMLSTFIAVTLLSIAASGFGIITLSVTKLLAVTLTATVGAIPFCAIGLLLGSLLSSRAAPAIVNVLYMLLIYFSGLFIQLPKAIGFVVTFSPAFYLHQLALESAGSKNYMIGGALTHIGILLGSTVLCLGIASRRLERVG